MTDQSAQVFIAVLGLLTAPVVLLAQWLLNKKKNRADVTSAISDASHDAVETMQTVMAELREQVTELKKENASLRDQIMSLHHEINKLRSRLP